MSRFSLILAALAVSLAGCDTASDEVSQRGNDAAQQSEGLAPPPSLLGKIVRFQAGTPLPDLTFNDPGGNTLMLSDLKGKPVLLNLWATWCAPCIKEMPLLDELANQMGDKIKVLTVSQDVRGADVVAPFFADRDFENLEQWLDPEAELGLTLTQGEVLPVTVLFDAEGRELFRVAGDYEWDSEEAIAAINEAIAE